jgi:hypothetical protein
LEAPRQRADAMTGRVLFTWLVAWPLWSDV